MGAARLFLGYVYTKKQEVECLYQSARQYIQNLQGTINLFVDKEDALIESYLDTLENGQIQVIGPEVVFGRIYDKIGFGNNTLVSAGQQSKNDRLSLPIHGNKKKC